MSDIFRLFASITLFVDFCYNFFVDWNGFISELSLGIYDLNDDIFFVDDLFCIFCLPFEEFY